MPSISRTKSNTFFVFFDGGTIGLVDGIAALNVAGRQKSTIKPVEKTVLDVLDSDGKILQKEAAKIEYLEEKDVQFQAAARMVSRKLTAVNYKHDYKVLTPGMVKIRGDSPQGCSVAGSADLQSIGMCTGGNVCCPDGLMAKAIRNIVNPLSDSVPVSYSIRAKIAEGSFGYVYEAVNSDGKDVAVKVTKGTCRSLRALQQTLHEVLMHDYIGSSSAYICGLIDVYVDNSKRYGSNSSGFHLVFPRMTFDLKRCLPTRPATARSARWVALSLLQAISYIHAKRVIHADISLRNVLVKAEHPHDALYLCQVQLADFGAAVFMNDRPGCLRRSQGPRKQTLPYRAPEVAMGEHHFSAVVDEWSVGAILYEILLGSPLLDASSDDGFIHSQFCFAGSAAMEAAFGNDADRFPRRQDRWAHLLFYYKEYVVCFVFGMQDAPSGM